MSEQEPSDVFKAGWLKGYAAAFRQHVLSRYPARLRERYEATRDDRVMREKIVWEAMRIDQLEGEVRRLNERVEVLERDAGNATREGGDG